jgi:pre-peptidase
MRPLNQLHRLPAALVALALCSTVTAQVCPNDDPFEGSNSCTGGSPIQLPVGTTNDLTIGTGVGGVDTWEYHVGPGDSVTIDVLFSQASGNLDAVLVNQWCSSIITSSQSTTDDEQLSYANGTTLPVVINLVVGHSVAPLPSCQDYTLVVTPVINACSTTPDDGYAPNHDCASAVASAPGTYTDLVTFRDTAEDFYSVVVGEGETLKVDVLFAHLSGDIDAYIYDPSTLGSTCGDKLDYLDRGYSSSDDESLSHTNLTGTTQTYYVQVNLYSSAANAYCNAYDLVIGVDPASVGTPTCFGDGSAGACPCDNESAVGAGEGCESSLGVGSILSANGTASVAADDLVFTVSQARATQPALLVQGASLTQVPFKDGILCAGNPTERVEVLFTDANGDGATTTSIVTNGNVVAGDTRWYQMWSRDPGGASPCATGSNFSNGMEVTFTP